MATLNPTLTERPESRSGGGAPPRPPAPGGEGGGNGLPGDGGVRLRRYRLGMIIALAPVAMLFVGLTSAYIVRQGLGDWDAAAGAHRPDWRPLNLPLVLLWINTAILLFSSVTLEASRRAVARVAEAGRGVPWLALTLILGLAFLAGQVAAWQHLAGRGVYIATNPSSSFFYVLTAAHAVHLAGGVLALLYAAAAHALRRPPETRALVLSVTAWYWHFMGLLWIYIFALLYFAR